MSRAGFVFVVAAAAVAFLVSVPCSAGEPGPTLVRPSAEYAQPVLEVAPRRLTCTVLGGQRARLTLTLRNGGGRTLNWAVESKPSWVTLTRLRGRLGYHESQTVTVTVNASRLPGGDHTGSIVLEAPGAVAMSVTVRIAAEVVGSEGEPETPTRERRTPSADRERATGTSVRTRTALAGGRRTSPRRPAAAPAYNIGIDVFVGLPTGVGVELPSVPLGTLGNLTAGFEIWPNATVVTGGPRMELNTKVPLFFGFGGMVGSTNDDKFVLGVYARLSWELWKEQPTRFRAVFGGALAADLVKGSSLAPVIAASVGWVF